MNESANDLFELRVLNGLHQGAALPLIGEQWAIGADDTLDLALHDAGVQHRHCQLQRDGERWSLEAADGRPVDVEGHSLAELQPNAPFALGSVWLCLAPAAAPWPNLPATTSGDGADDRPGEQTPLVGPATPRGALLGRAACITLGVLLGVVGSAWSLSSATLAPSEPAPAASAPASTAAPAKVPDTRQAIDAQSAARLLKTMLSERMLTAVSLEHTPQGLALSGTLKNDSMRVYERMLQRFNAQHRIDFKLDDRVLSGNGGLPFAITQIIGGSNGHLVMADGRRMYIGDRIDGVRLVQIDNGRIQFDGEQQLEVSW
ncbi:type III secretion protein D [Pseudomonas flavescens]|uniref:Type III secretion protein D n=1 Tax=Phytopseudomonas flavescens TaxID=29435 RepID=A0A1G8DK60_9GAMM|nr:FHA domain-containing protein [Pseudomonas flavescens]SDH57961.1 type III secretion protein D [Pseudomonas flavescens]